jgi:ankyrin repeat protein
LIVEFFSPTIATTSHAGEEHAMRKHFLYFLVLIPCLLFGQDLTGRFYQAIRHDDLAALRMLIQQNGPNAKDARGQTPIMFAAAYGSPEALKILISNGADVSAQDSAGQTALHRAVGNAQKVRLLLEKAPDRRAYVNKATRLGRTALTVAAATTGALDSIKLLLTAGAEVNIADTDGVTPLIAASLADNAAVVRLLAEKGADINAKTTLAAPATALMGAAHAGNTELTKFLLSRKADVKAISSDRSGNVKNGPVAFGYVNALHLAVIGGSVETVRLLLEAGAPVDTKDVRGMTALMIAVSTDRPNVAVVRLLLAHGANASLRDNNDESVLDWARKFSNPSILAALNIPVSNAASISALKADKIADRTPEEAVQRSLALLQRTSANLFTDGGCVACHAQPIVGMALTHVRSHGWTVDEGIEKSWQTESARVVNSLNAAVASLLQARDSGGMPDTQLYDTMMMITENAPATDGTDAEVYYLAAKQKPQGNWTNRGATRAPIQDGDFSKTAMAIRTLAAYGMPARKTELQERINRAADWLARQSPLSTEDRVMQILGLKWAKTNRGQKLHELVAVLMAMQRSDGGWAQTPYLASDAYATGQVLYTLSEMGVSPQDSAFRRGADFLVRTQRSDGSWYVKSRAMKIQPYFQSGFPYEHDQWISNAGTAWAIIGLSVATQDSQPSAAVSPR